MTEPISKTKTGLFVTIGLGLLLCSILFFGGDRVFFTDFTHYQAKFPSTQGLGRGSVVSLSGMEVGNVRKIVFDDDAQLVAVLNINSKYKGLIGQDSVASIRTQGALGDKYIYITPGTDERPLAEGAFIATQVQADLLDLLSGSSKSGPDITVVANILKELNQLLYNLNSNGKSAMLMENLVAASQDVSKLMNEPTLRESLSHFRNILKKIDKGEGTLGQLINDPSFHERLMGLMGDTPRNKYLKPLLREAIKENEKKR